MILTFKEFLNEARGINSEIKLISQELNTFIGDHIINMITKYNNTKYNKVKLLIDDTTRNVWRSIDTVYYNVINKYKVLNFNKIQFNITTIIDTMEHHILDNNFDLYNSLQQPEFIPIINLTFYISNTDLKSVFNAGYVSSAIHEIQHVFELLNIVNKNIDYSKSWESNFKLLELDRAKIFELYYFIYVCLKHEIRARVAQIYELLKEIKSKNLIDYEKFIMNTHIWKTIEKLEVFDCIEYMKKFTPEEQLEIMNNLNLILNTKYNNIDSWCNNINKWFRKTSVYYKEKLLKVGKESYTDFNNEKLGFPSNTYVFL